MQRHATAHRIFGGTAQSFLIIIFFKGWPWGWGERDVPGILTMELGGLG